MNAKKKTSFVKGAGLLMCATIIAKAIGACYRIPLTNILGAEGMGLYQLVFPVYSLILSLSSGGFSMAVSVLVSSGLAVGDEKSARRVVRSTLIVAVTTGTVLALTLATLSGVIGRLQGAEDAKFGYVVIAPSVLCVSALTVYKGWFQGTGRTGPTATTQIIEAISKLIVGLALSYVLKERGVVYAVVGAITGVTAGEVVSVVFLAVLYHKENDFKSLRIKIEDYKTDFKSVLALSAPITLSGMIFPLTQFIDSFLVVNILSRGMPLAEATADYGLVTGPVGTLINLPVALGLAIGIAVAPRLSEDRKLRHLEAIRLKGSTAIKSALTIGVPFFALYISSPKAILGFLYSGLKSEEIALSALLLTIGAGGIIFLSVTEICTSILQGLGNTSSPTKNMAIGGAVKIILDITLLFTLGIQGVTISSLIAYGLTALLNALSLIRLIGKNADVIKKSGVIVGLGGIIGVPTAVASHFGLKTGYVLAVACISGIAYLTSVVALPIFSEEETLSLPFGKYLLAIRLRTSPPQKEQ